MSQFNDGCRANVSQVVSCDALDLNEGIAFVEPSGATEVTANGVMLVYENHHILEFHCWGVAT